jgi:hypothetical protein
MLVTSKLGDIDVNKPIPWLWPGYIPAGKVVLIYGDGGLGKSTLGIDIAAKVCTDGVMPDGSQGMTGKVLIISVEDDKTFIAKRLTAAGAPSKGEFAPDIVDAEQGFDISEGMVSLQAFIHDNDIKLVVLDPLEQIAGGINLNRANQVRDKLFSPLGSTMAATGCTAVIMHHTNKTDTNSASNKSSGNKAIVNASRAAYMVTPDLKDKETSLLVPVKSNMSKTMPTLRFQFEEDEELGVGYIEWVGSSLVTKNDIVDSTSRGRGAPPRARMEAVQFIKDFLADGPKLASDLEAAAKDTISPRTLQRARQDAGVMPFKRDTKNYIALPGKTDFKSDNTPKKKLKRKGVGQNGDQTTRSVPDRDTRTGSKARVTPTRVGKGLRKAPETPKTPHPTSGTKKKHLKREKPSQGHRIPQGDFDRLMNLKNSLQRAKGHQSRPTSRTPPVGRSPGWHLFADRTYSD